VENAVAQGVKTGYVRLKTLWPFPEKTIKKLAEKAEKIIVPEMNLRQIFYEVERAAEGKANVIPINKIGGGELIAPEEIMHKILEEAKKGDG
jgi:2-oxoglutarate ferredoxin oxidoreductase subunit alpha